MCKAIDDMKKEAIDLGISEGLSQGRSLGIEISKYLIKNYTQQKTKAEIINELINDFGISKDVAKMSLDYFLNIYPNASLSQKKK